MGAGGRSGPCGKAGDEGRQGECECRIRHEHAFDEQCVRYGHVAERSLNISGTDERAREGPFCIGGVGSSDLTPRSSVPGDQIRRQV